jgi:hypothetical protein
VVKDFQQPYIKGAYPEIDRYLSMDRAQLRAHCREVGLEYRGFENLNKRFKQAIAYLYNT